MRDAIIAIKNKRYVELTRTEMELIDDIVEKYALSLEQRNGVFLSFLFDLSVVEAFKKIMMGAE